MHAPKSHPLASVSLQLSEHAPQYAMHVAQLAWSDPPAWQRRRRRGETPERRRRVGSCSSRRRLQGHSLGGTATRQTPHVDQPASQSLAHEVGGWGGGADGGADGGELGGGAGGVSGCSDGGGSGGTRGGQDGDVPCGPEGGQLGGVPGGGDGGTAGGQAGAAAPHATRRYTS